MKSSTLLLSILFFVASLTQAQVQIGKTGWQIKQIGVTLGVDQDRISSMNQSDFFSSIKNNAGDYYRGIQFEEENITSESMICENPNIRAQAAFTHPRIKNGEFRLAVNVIWDRIDAMAHEYNNTHGDFSSFTIDAYSNEIALELAYLHRVRLGGLSLYGGIGTNAGRTFGSEVCVNGYNITIDQSLTQRDGATTPPQMVHHEYIYDCHSARNSTHLRTFLQAGAGLDLFKRFQLEWQFRYGIGAKLTPDVGIQRTNLVSMGIGVNYLFRE